MTRRILAATVALGVILLGWWLWLGRGLDQDVFSGYVEADYVFVTSPVGGVVKEVAVARGDQVKAGAKLFALDDVAERGARDQAAAQLQQAEAQAANLMTGRRPAEVAAVAAQQAAAQAALKSSEAEYQRQVELNQTGVSTRQRLDAARAQRDSDRARVREVTAQVRVAQLPGRDQDIRAAEASVAAAQGALQQAQWRLDQKTGIAPAAGIVVDTLYRPGEVAQGSLPIVQLLPPENIKIRFFVPEGVVARIRPGQALRVTCDGCGAPIAATVRYISPRAEFTPPVIYSREQRSRMVFMVEAKPTERLEALRVGQPTDVAVVTEP